MTDASSIDGAAATATGPATEMVPDGVSVLTYNVKGLPWPLARGRDAAFASIEQRLAGLRAIGAHPDIVVLQEAFTARAKQIGERSGYAYHADGPAPDEPVEPAGSPGGDAFSQGGSALKGETLGKWIDSGLRISSDYPIVAVRRAAFPADACAGYDCLANKGVLLVEVSVPGQAAPVTIVTTHLNSRRASGVGEARSFEAYRRQIAAVDGFIQANRNPKSPLIVAGDFNASSAARREILAQARIVPAAQGGPTANSGLHVIRRAARLNGKLGEEAAHIARRGRDWQFFGDGALWSLRPAGLSIPFGREKDGSSLSDHLGFVIDYRIAQASRHD